MVTSDEDLELFLVDLGRVLRKYHYDISPFTLRKISDPTIVIGGFSALNRDGVLSPKYFRLTPENLKLLGNEEDEQN